MLFYKEVAPPGLMHFVTSNINTSFTPLLLSFGKLVLNVTALINMVSEKKAGLRYHYFH